MKKLLLGALALLTSYSASAYTFYNSNNTGALDLNARFYFTHKVASQNYNTFNYNGLKSSFISIAPYANFNRVQIGGTYINRWYSYSPSNYLHNKTGSTYIFIQSPKLGRTSIGKTRGVYEDFMLRAQAYNISLTNYIPVLTEYNHNWVFKYTSGFNNYYNYGFSLTNYRKTQTGTLRQLSFNLNYQWHFFDDQHLETDFLYTSQKFILGHIREYSVHPFAASFRYTIDNVVKFSATPYFARERVKEFTMGNYTYYIVHKGLYANLNFPFGSSANLYLGYGFHHKTNDNPITAISTDGSTIDAGKKRIMQMYTAGFNAGFNKHLTLVGEASVIKDTALPDGNRVDYLGQLGFLVKF